MLNIDLDAAAWTQSKVMDGIRHDPLPWHKMKDGLLNNSGDEQLALYQRKVVANTDARSGPEGDVGIRSEERRVGKEC